MQKSPRVSPDDERIVQNANAMERLESNPNERLVMMQLGG